MQPQRSGLIQPLALMRVPQILIASLLAFGPPAGKAATSDLTHDNAALIRHIKTTDDIFVKILGTCGSEKLSRGKGGKFTYQGNCQIKPLPETDCQRYLVLAIGTVDTKSWATIRDIHLTLQCSA